MPMLKPFDPSRDFVVMAFQPPLRAAGIGYQRGDPFQKTTVSERVLRQLYEQRQIVYSDGPPVKRAPLTKLLARFGKAVRAHVTTRSAIGQPVADGNEAAAAAVGDASTAAAALVTEHSHGQLLKLADGLEGASKSKSKQELAQMIVDARVPAGG